MSRHTVHEYVTLLYRHYDVHSRAELLTLLLRHNRPADESRPGGTTE